VVPFVDVGTSGGMHYLAWPLVEGETLDKVMEREGKMTPGRAAQIALQAAEGLEQCHQQHLFHGLLKPSNLMLGTDGQVRILDFGIGCLLAETEGESLVDTMSTANSVSSGLDCASPESIMDPTNLTPVGDQYSLGCVLYHFLTGRYPFPDGTAVEKMMCHQHKQPTPVKELAPETPDDLVAVVERLMQKAPANRYPSCAELIEALRPLAAQSGPVRRPSMSIPRVKLPRPDVRTPAPADAAPAAAPAGPTERLNPATPRPQQPKAADAPAPAGRPRPALPPRPVLPPRPAAAPTPEPEPKVLAASKVPSRVPDVVPAEPWGERFGTVGVVLLAVLAGVVAYSLSFLIKF
jgi:serine/threonine-protein kinase